MEKLIIEKIDGKWSVNGKFYNELSPNERNALVSFIKEYDFAEMEFENQTATFIVDGNPLKQIIEMDGFSKYLGGKNQ